jgi:hypothetical protein
VANWPNTLPPGAIITDTHYNSLVTALHNYPVGADPINCNFVDFVNMGAFAVTGTFGISGTNIAGSADVCTGLLLDRVYDTAGDTMDIVFGGGSGMSGTRAGRISCNATTTSQTSFLFYLRNGGDGYSNEVMRVTGTGLVSIGTAGGPSEKLHLIGGSRNYLRIDDSVNNVVAHLGVESNIGYIGMSTAHDFVVRTFGTERMRFRGSSGGGVITGQLIVAGPNTPYLNSNSGGSIVSVALGPAQTDIALLFGIDSGILGWIRAVKPGTGGGPLFLNYGNYVGTYVPSSSAAGVASVVMPPFPTQTAVFWLSTDDTKLQVSVKTSTGAIKTGFIAIS